MKPGSVPLSTTPDVSLPAILRTYKNLYRSLIGISVLLLACIGVYFVLWRKETAVAHSPLDPATRLSGIMATDSSGRMIAIVAINDADTLTSILVSENGGLTFSVMGGPWKISGDDDERIIKEIYIAPNHKTIIALANNVVYLKRPGTDSFLTVNNLITTSYFPRLRGLSFSHVSDSVFVFSADSIYAFNYNRFDSVNIGYLRGLTNLQDLTTGRLTNRVAGVGISEEYHRDGAFMNYYISGWQSFPVSIFNNKIRVSPDVGSMDYADTVAPEKPSKSGSAKR